MGLKMINRRRKRNEKFKKKREGNIRIKNTE